MKKLIFISALLFCSILISYGQWTYSNLSEPRSHMGAAVLGTKAYFAGGKNGNNLLSTVEIYNAQTEEWDPIESLSQARMLPAGVACGSKVLFAGGIDLTGPPYTAYDEVDIFDTLTQEWTVEYLSVPRIVAAVCYENTVLFAGGGTVVPWASYDIVDIYNIESGEWSIEYLSEARDARTATVVGDLAMFAGGNSNGSVSQTVDIYNFTTGIWSVDFLSVPRDRLQEVTVDNKVLFAGGMTPDNERSDVVDIYDATTGIWSIDTLSFPRAFSNNTCGAKACDKAFFAGGGNLDLPTLYWNDVYDDIDIYDEVSDTWTQDNLAIARIEHVVAGVGNQLVVAGGLNSSWQQISSVEIYTCPSSSCLPEGITFSTQEEIDNFQINYPYCTDIEGNVNISGSDITNLNGLNVLTSIGGFLKIEDCESLVALTGLDNLSSVGGNIELNGNETLSSLTGLEGLTELVGNLSIWDNDNVTNLSGLDNVETITGNLAIGHIIGTFPYGNISLFNLSGLNNLSTIGGSLVIIGNTSLVNLSSLDNLTFIGEHINLWFNQSLTNLTALGNVAHIGGSINIEDNSSLTSLSGLENIDSIHGTLRILKNNTLVSLTGLDSLVSIGGSLKINENHILISLASFENLAMIGGDLQIFGNDTLNNLEGLGNIDPNSIIDLRIENNSSLSTCDVQSICDYLDAPNGSIEIIDNAPGCDSQEEVDSLCNLVSVQELKVENEFTISPNPNSGSANLRFVISKPVIVICDLFEISGVRVKSLINEVKYPGVHEIEIDLNDIPAGIYFCILKTNEGTQSKKVIKLD